MASWRPLLIAKPPGRLHVPVNNTLRCWSGCRCTGFELAVASVRQATIAVLLKLAVPDTLILLIAFSAGVVAALGQAAIPYFIGRSVVL